MMLAGLILIPLAGGFATWLFGRRSPGAGRGIALAAMLADVALVAAIALSRGGETGPWWLTLRAPWIPQLGVQIHLAVDGLSWLLLVLTAGIGVIAVLVSWREIEDRAGLFYACLLWILGGINGVFISLDLFLFYFCWEVMLVPMYFLIAIWGHERRAYAAIKFFLFTIASGLAMLAAIIGLYVLHGQATGSYTFDYLQLLETPLSAAAGLWLMVGFLIAFAVKLPVVPLHCWLPDAHSQAPTAGSLILAALLLKTGAYGLIRFVLPLFPEAAEAFAPWGMLLGAAGIIYGASLAFSQTDLKRLVAYTSVSHMGFVFLGVFAGNELALQGTVMQMICHGISTGALFIVAGMLYERLHTRDLSEMGGLWHGMPRLGAAGLLFALASLGLPGMGNFVSEILILFGAFRASPALTAVAAGGVVLATIYSLRIVQRVFFGPRSDRARQTDLSLREAAILAVLAAAILWLGLFPQPVLRISQPPVRQTIEVVR